MRRGFSTMYGRAPDGQGDTSRTGQSGEQGEYVDVTLNRYATLVNQSVVRTTAEKPAFRAVATNADSASLEQASFGQGLLEYYSNTHSVADRDWEMVEIGVICSEGWEIYGWDATAGKNITDFTDEAALNEGDVEVHATTPFRVAYDPDAESIDRLKWAAYKRRYNRFDLAMSVEARGDATSVATAQKLRDMTADDGLRDDFGAGASDMDLDMDMGAGRYTTAAGASADLVWIWELRHLPSPALPNGRLLRFASGDCVVYDGAYPYAADDLHMYRFSPATVVGSIAGHAPSFDLIGLQELKDTVATQAATAANAGGITNLWSRTGDKPSLSQVVGSMNFFQSANKPEKIDGVELSPQIPAFDAMLDENMQSRMGESDVSMGDVPRGMPGNLAALLEAKTVQYASRSQASYAHVLERSRTGILKLLQRFANSERVAVIGGISGDYEHKSWSSKDLRGMDRFIVESVSPISQSYAGRVDSARELLEHGEITAQQYLLMKETGRLEPVFEGKLATEMGIRKERQMLAKGIGLSPVDAAESFRKGLPVFVDDGKQHVRPLIYDKHWLHILEDLSALAAPEARDDVTVTVAVLGVVEERVRLMRLVDPVMLAVLGYPPEIQQAITMSEMSEMPGRMRPSAAPAPGGTDESGDTSAPRAGIQGLPSGAPSISAPKPAKPPRDPITGVQAPSPVEGIE